MGLKSEGALFGQRENKKSVNKVKEGDERSALEADKTYYYV